MNIAVYFNENYAFGCYFEYLEKNFRSNLV